MTTPFLSRRRSNRRLLLGLTIAAAVAATVVLVWSGDDTATPPVSTVAVVNTPVDIGCLDDPGAEAAEARHWYSYDAKGGLNLDGEIVPSLRIGDYAALAFDEIHAHVGSYATSAIRDVAPDPSFCTTDRFVGVEFADGSELNLLAWRSVAAASPQWVPSEVPFVQVDDSTFVSEGPHLVAVMKVAPDGTTVAAIAYGINARERFARASGPIPVSTLAVDLGSATITVAQLTPIAEAMLAFSVAR
ncbi:MAG: hypothetical protein Q7V57_11765 [Actinomycetota bacterium]|nr:hypothetical protein [Actinomycetota bacterium]